MKLKNHQNKYLVKLSEHPLKNQKKHRLRSGNTEKQSLTKPRKQTLSAQAPQHPRKLMDARNPPTPIRTNGTVSREITASVDRLLPAPPVPPVALLPLVLLLLLLLLPPSFSKYV